MEKHEVIQAESISGESPIDGSKVAAVDISGVDKAKVLRKMDLRLIPIVTVLYLFSFLDRGYVKATYKKA